MAICGGKQLMKIWIYCGEQGPSLIKGGRSLSLINQNERYYCCWQKTHCEGSLNGRIIGSCYLKEIKEYKLKKYKKSYDIPEFERRRSHLSLKGIMKYGDHVEPLFGWVLEDIKEESNKSFREFYSPTKNVQVDRPPITWLLVKHVEEEGLFSYVDDQLILYVTPVEAMGIMNSAISMVMRKAKPSIYKEKKK